MINLQGMTEKKLFEYFTLLSPQLVPALGKSATIGKQVKIYQAAAIYHLMSKYNKPGNILMEIGTRLGYSAAVIGQAVPEAKVITYESVHSRATRARELLRAFENVKVRHGTSWDVLKKYKGPMFSAIFVDGHHKYAKKDAPWFNWLKEDGLILFHDYTEHNAPPVVRAVEAMAVMLDRPPDIEIVDENGVGMAGFYRQEGERVTF